MPIATSDNLVEEVPIGGDAVEVATASQGQGLVEGILEMPMMGFDGTVLMGLSWIVTARLEAVVVPEGL